MEIQLSRISYYPSELPPFQIKAILPQFVFCVLGVIEIMESGNPFEILFHATPSQARLIQMKVNKVMPLIELSSKLAVYEQMFLNGIFWGGKFETIAVQEDHAPNQIAEQS